jgi:hypothetical protein
MQPTCQLIQPTLANLKRIAAKNHCSIEDDKNDTRIWVNANIGWSFDDGERSANVHAYGSDGHYKSEWRNNAIKEAIDRLIADPPTNTPYNDEQ